jgi:hypothetical protein
MQREPQNKVNKTKMIPLKPSTICQYLGKSSYNPCQAVSRIHIDHNDDSPQVDVVAYIPATSTEQGEYEIKISLRADGSSIQRSSCTCPVPSKCKHIFKVLCRIAFPDDCPTGPDAHKEECKNLEDGLVKIGLSARKTSNTTTAQVLTARQVLEKGLDIIGISSCRRARLSTGSLCRKFKKHFGCHPLHCARAWQDCVTATSDSPYHIPPEKANFTHFLATLNFLKLYQDEEVRADWIKAETEKLLSPEIWYHAKKISALKSKKVVFPKEWDTHFIITVDGTHCRINEPREPGMRRNRKHYSHKDHHAGLNYEIAISIFESKVVHAKTQSRASCHDISEFRKELRGKIPPGKRVIADKAYDAEEDSHILSTNNQFDAESVKEFKRRARARHETFNGIMKEWKCLDTRFRHGRNKHLGCPEHQICFDAVLVMCQYLIEDTGPHGRPLFDV